MKFTAASLGVLLLVTFMHRVAGFVAFSASFGVLTHRPLVAPTVPIPSLCASSSDNDGPSIRYVDREQMEEILEDFDQGESGYCVLDVRNEAEVEMTGKLAEGVITCPLPKLQEMHAFELHPQDFQEEFGFEKPHFDETLVFTCAAGKRAQMAAELAAIDGYPNIVVYKGGSNEWFGPPSLVEVP